MNDHLTCAVVLAQRRMALYGDGLLAESVATLLQAAGAELIPGDQPAAAQLAVVMDGHGVVDQLRALDLPAVVVVEGDAPYASHLHLVLAGAVGVVTVDEDGEDLVRAVARVLAGEAVLAPEVVRLLAERAARAAARGATGAAIRLTPREQAVLECIVRGLSVKQTGVKLGIVPKTVENTQSRLYRRLGVRNRAQAVLVAHEHGLVP
jgi:DNA-binding NarL/FixJ family response regulator